jgi:cysteine desulfurase / selenocysteine lyase
MQPMTTIAVDIDTLRAETPGCRQVLHFNNAGAALMPESVVRAVTDYIRLEAEIGGYEAARMREAEIAHVYDAVAALLDAQSDEIAIMQNATRAWQQVFYAIPFRPGDRILTSMAEYASNYIAYLQVAERTGVMVEPVPNDESGQLSLTALAGMLDARVRLVAVTHVPTNGGLVNPAEEIGRLAKQAGALYLLDACQSAGQMPLDVSRIGCDFLSATSRKYLRGPRGAGFLYVRRDCLPLLTPPMLDLHAATWTAPDRYEIRPDARRFENWEAGYATNIGLGVAVDYAMNLGLDWIWERVQMLGERLREALGEIPGVTVRDLGVVRCGIVSFTVNGRTPQAVFEALSRHSINVSYSPPQYTLLDMRARHLDEGIVRASVHYYNTEEEIVRFCDALRQVLV